MFAVVAAAELTACCCALACGGGGSRTRTGSTNGCGLGNGDATCLGHTQQPKEEGQRCQRVELGTLLFQRLHGDLDLLAAVVQAAFHGIFGAFQLFRNFPDADLLIVMHHDGDTLLRTQSVQNAVDETGGLVAVHRRLRLMLHTVVGVLQVDLFSFFVQPLREEDRLFLPQIVQSGVGGQLFHPCLVLFRVVQLVQILKTFDKAVLHDVQRILLVLDDGPDALVNAVIGLFVKFRNGLLITGSGQQNNVC